jgi:uncharacterized protein YicC (UPF0701 family)
MAYGATTDVPLEKSIAEVVAMLKKAGAARIGQVEEPESFTIQFFMTERMIRFRVPLPELDTIPKLDGRGAHMSAESRLKRLKQAHRQKGRALMIVVKAKLESIESQVETFEEAFLANVVMADGATLYERLQEPIRIEYASGKVAPLMLGGPR